jgi:hypothetical protein
MDIILGPLLLGIGLLLKLLEHQITDAIHALAPNQQWTITNRDYSTLDWESSNSVSKPSESDLTNKVTALDAAEPARLMRVERDKRLAACDWRASSDLTIDVEWRTYRQELRDLPASSTPRLDSNYDLDLTSVTWPTEYQLARNNFFSCYYTKSSRK